MRKQKNSLRDVRRPPGLKIPWLPEGRNIFRSAKDHYSTAAELMLCPTCSKGPSLTVNPAGLYLCASEMAVITEKRVADMWIRLGFCPSCSGPLVKFGRRGGETTQRYLCSFEGTTCREDSSRWKKLVGINDDKFREGIVLKLMGWTTNRIQERIRISRTTTQELFGKDVYFELLDAGTDLKQSHLPLYYWVWRSLQATWAELERAGTPPPFELPEFKPWTENILFNEFLKRLSAAASDNPIKLCLPVILKSFEDALLAVGKGQLSKRQAAAYRAVAPEHLAKILSNLLSTEAPGGGILDTTCLDCGCARSKSSDSNVRRVDRGVHGGLCLDLKDAVTKLRAHPNVAKYLENRIEEDTAPAKKPIAQEVWKTGGFKFIGRERDVRRRQKRPGQ